MEAIRACFASFPVNILTVSIHESYLDRRPYPPSRLDLVEMVVFDNVLQFHEARRKGRETTKEKRVWKGKKKEENWKNFS